MENNVTFCSWQVSREPGRAFLSFASFASFISAGNFGMPWKLSAHSGIGSSEFADPEFERTIYTHLQRRQDILHPPDRLVLYISKTRRWLRSKKVYLHEERINSKSGITSKNIINIKMNVLKGISLICNTVRHIVILRIEMWHEEYRRNGT